MKAQPHPLSLIVFGTLLVLAAGCLRNDSTCDSASDCFSGESCNIGVCTPMLAGGPAPESFIDATDLGIGYELVLDDRDEPSVFVLNNDGTLVRWWWDGFIWAQTHITADIDFDNTSVVHASHARGAGFVVVVGQASSPPAVFHSADGESWSEEQAFDEWVVNPTVASHGNDVVICAFSGDLSDDFDRMQPHLAVRGRAGNWTQFELPDPATPFCPMAFSDRGFLTVALAHWDDDYGHRTRFAQTVVNPIVAMDLTLSGDFTGVPVSSSSLDVQGGAAVLLHASTDITQRILWVTRILDFERTTTRVVQTIPMDRFYGDASVRADPLDDRRALVALSTLATSGDDVKHVLGPLLPDHFDGRPIDAREQEAWSVAHRVGTDGVVRMVFSTPKGLVFRIGL